jgi:hypothetical protein
MAITASLLMWQLVHGEWWPQTWATWAWTLSWSAPSPRLVLIEVQAEEHFQVSYYSTCSLNMALPL